jgi:2-polyprenyl-6-hydroxyphenyl methylase/3-demethylubiquinone-9 3-methyltransferase
LNREPGWRSGGVLGEEHGAREAALGRLAFIDTALRGAGGRPEGAMQVADVGCGAGVQSRLWAERGHQVYGADINKALIALARKRAREAGLGIAFEVAPATALPWPDRSMDLCIVPGLIEHVADWRACLAEFVRILKPGGALYISTTNVLCPVQDEFRLPLYSWYPGFVKRHYEDLACTSRPELARYALYPAINWFTWYGLRNHLARHGLASMDRFDMLDPGSRGYAVRLLRALPPLRFAAHVATPYTVLLALKPAA